MNPPKTIETVEQLEELLSDPAETVVEMMRRLEGDILFLGAGGKIGPSLARMARRASDIAETSRRIIAISRFTAADEEANLNRHGIETIRCDLLDEAAVAQLPGAANVVYLAGLKFGSAGRLPDTWALNTYLPSVVCRKFRESRIVAFSTGAVYGLTGRAGGGSRETDPPAPIGEYAMSCLGRERMFEYFSRASEIPIVLIRLFYACELRYGVLVDLARSILAGDPIDLAMGYFNVIWQGDNNAMALRALGHVTSPPFIINVTGPEVLSIREVAEEMGRLLDKAPNFSGAEQNMTCLGNIGKSQQLFGAPRVSARQLMKWVADWVKRGKVYLGKPTHFEVRDGKY
jgi:nucleoside-diphosphate-sugar epimerase